MRLIDADALKDEVNKKKLVGRFNTLLLIDNAPTVDMSTELSVAYLKGRRQGQSEARSKGEWIMQRHDLDGCFYTCSNCGRMIRVSRFIDDTEDNETLADYPFCHCGADMRKIEDEISDPVISAIQENNAKYNERPNIDFSRMSYDLGGSNKSNCVICDHFGKCEECEKREEE